MNKTGWKFPKTGGGKEDGHNDSGISHFSGAKFSSLAREIIQNSLDASLSSPEPVKVEFKTQSISINKFPGAKQILEIFKKCIQRCKEKKDGKALNFYNKGVKILNGTHIQFLQIADYNTTGLTDENDLWYNLAKAHGDSGKSSVAGGSHGIGKYAPYAVSDLRTVFYSTMYSNVHKAQGRAVLITHTDDDGKKRQGTGFYGEYGEDDCDPIPSAEIPAFLSRDDPGTTVSIAGFNADNGWNKRIAAAVMSNFFVAIKNNYLRVSIDGLKEDIAANTLDKHFSQISKDDGDSKIKIAKQMYEALEKGTERDIQLRSGLGHCKLRVMQGDGLPKVVGIVRGTGMLITTELEGLKKFPGFGDFVAICICPNKEGNELLREMENPKHDAFEPERLEERRHIGEKALKELAKKVRDSIKEIVTPNQSSTYNIGELHFFPDPDDASGEGDDGPDRDFEKGLVVTKKPRTSHSRGGKEGTEGTGESEGVGESEGEEEFGGAEESEGEGTNGKKNKSAKKSNLVSLAITNIRIRKQSESEKKHDVFLTPKESGNVNLVFRIAGDQKVDEMPILPACLTRAKNINVTKGERVHFVLETEQNIEGAIRVDAYKNMDNSQPSTKEGGKQ